MNGLLIATTLILISAGQLLQKLAADKASRALPKRGLLVGLIRQPEAWWAVICLGGGHVFLASGVISYGGQPGLPLSGPRLCAGFTGFSFLAAGAD